MSLSWYEIHTLLYGLGVLNISYSIRQKGFFPLLLKINNFTSYAIT